MFDAFEKVASNQTEHRWETLSGQLTAQQKTNARFRQVMDNFHLSYCDDNARDTMFDYLRNFTKPYSVTAGIHTDLMEILFNYANRLPGLEPPNQEAHIRFIPSQMATRLYSIRAKNPDRITNKSSTVHEGRKIIQ